MNNSEIENGIELHVRWVALSLVACLVVVALAIISHSTKSPGTNDVDAVARSDPHISLSKLDGVWQLRSGDYDGHALSARSASAIRLIFTTGFLYVEAEVNVTNLRVLPTPKNAFNSYFESASLESQTPGPPPYVVQVVESLGPSETATPIAYQLSGRTLILTTKQSHLSLTYLRAYGP